MGIAHQSRFLFPACFVIVFMAMTSRPTSAQAACQDRPHIVYILADDLGWRDVSWNSPDAYTPNLARLRNEGVALANHYMQPACSASRAALLTGYYPWKKFGLQRNDLDDYHRWRNLSLPMDVTILPQYLKRLCYNTHLVGKWQMGFCNVDLTPTYRGFDSFYGSYGGNSDHFLHSPTVGGYDFRDNLQVDLSANGSYSTDLYTDRTERIIREHHLSKSASPLFILLAYEAPHEPVQAPDAYIAEHCGNFTDGEKRLRCGMMVALDQGVGRVMDTLTELGYDKNLLVVFSSDNGAPSSGAGSNWPLRGKKRSVYEGGVRVPSFVWSRNLLAKPKVFKGTIHVTDWLPTLLSAALAEDVTGLLPSDVDGVNQWPNLLSNSGGRTNMVLDIDPAEGYGAVRSGKWKLVKDPSGKGCWGWFNIPSGESFLPSKLKCAEYQLFDLVNDPYEQTDVAAANPSKLQQLKLTYESMVQLATPLPFAMNITESFPENTDGIWGPGWC